MSQSLPPSVFSMIAGVRAVPARMDVTLGRSLASSGNATEDVSQPAAIGSSIVLFGQDAVADAAANQPPSLFSPWTMFLAASIFLFYTLVLAPEKRRKSERDHLLAQLRKNDRVVTSGGIHGTIASVAADEDVVTLKVDGNTRLKLSRSAIAEVIRDETPSDGKKSDSEN